MNERMRSNATAPSDASSGSSSTTPMSAIFIGAVAVSAQRAHKSGTCTRTMNGGLVVETPADGMDSMVTAARTPRITPRRSAPGRLGPVLPGARAATIPLPGPAIRQPPCRRLLRRRSAATC
jgi:hypothetical protein